MAAGEVQQLIVELGIRRAQTISKLKSKVNSWGVPTNTSARNVNRRLTPPRRSPPRSSSRAMNVQKLKQVETRNMVPMLENKMTWSFMCDDATTKWTSHAASRSATEIDYVAPLLVGFQFTQHHQCWAFNSSALTFSTVFVAAGLQEFLGCRARSSEAPIATYCFGPCSWVTIFVFSKTLLFVRFPESLQHALFFSQRVASFIIRYHMHACACILHMVLTPVCGAAWISSRETR